MAASVLFDSVNGMRDVEDKRLENNCVLVWIASTNSWVPRPYNDGSGDPGSMVLGNPVIGGYAFHVLYIDEDGKLNQWHTLSQDIVKDLIPDLNSKAPKSSPYLSGEPKAAAPRLDDNSLRIATTGYVQGQGFEKSEHKGKAFGYPSLDSTGRIPVEQLPTSVTAGASPPLRGEVVGTAPGSIRKPSITSGRRFSSTIDPGIIRLSTAVLDKFAPNGSLFKGADHSNKLCYKDDQGNVHELYS